MSNVIMYLAMDETNHGESNPKIGEIVVVGYSFNADYWKPKKSAQPNALRAGAGFLRDVDFIFTVIPHTEARNYSNLPWVAPYLITPLMHQFSINQGRLALDGKLRESDKDLLVSTFKKEHILMAVENYVKGKQRISSGPRLVPIVHKLAFGLYHLPPEEISQNGKYVPLNLSVIAGECQPLLRA